MELTSSEWFCNAGRRVIGKLVVLVLTTGVLCLAWTRQACAAVSTTTVQGTVYLANGQPGSGMLHVSWPAFTTANGQAIVADSSDVTVGQDGFLSVNLAANQGAMPGGLYYTAVFYMSDGSVSTQYWVVPAAAQATLAQVQVQVMPAAQAVQAVNKAYVDEAIAQVNQSMLTGSGGTLAGPLFLSGDPAQPLQAADKHYVDLAVSQTVSNVNPASPGQVAYYAQNGTSVNGMSTVPLTAGGTGSTTSTGALQNLGGISSAATSAQNMAGPLILSAPYDSNTTNMMQAATAQNVRNAAPRSVKEYGAKGNGIFSDFKMSAGSNIVQLVDFCCGYTFAPGDVGKLISLPNVDSDHGTLYTTITGYTDSSHVTVATPATYAFDGTGTFVNQAMWTSDDAAAIAAAITAANTGRQPGLGATRDGTGQIYLPCGYYGVSSQISVPTGMFVQGESEGCAVIMYMGTTAIDAAVEVSSNQSAGVLRNGLYLTNTNHPEIGGCTGTACSPALNGATGWAKNLTIFGNKYSNWAFSVLMPANYLAENVQMYGGSTGCFYHVNDVETTWTHLRCATDNLYGRGQPVDGIYTDGTGLGQGPIPFKIQSPWVTNATGTGMVFNWVAGGTVSDGQISQCNKSVDVRSTSGNITFEGNLFEGASTPDLITGGNHVFTNDSFTGIALNIVGPNNHVLGGEYSATINISGANTVLDSLSVNSASQIVDTSKTTQILHLASYGGIGSPISRYTMDQSVTPTFWSADGVLHARGTFPVATNQVIVSTQFNVGQAWKAIFIGNWLHYGTVLPLPAFTELTDTNNSVTSGGITLTFSVNSGGYFQGTLTGDTNFTAAFIGDIFLIPRQASAGSGGVESMSLSADLAIPSITLAGGTAMTSNHGNGVRVQHSDGTGTSGIAYFDANGNLTGTASGTVSATQVNGAAMPVSKSLVGTNSSGQIIDASGILAGPGPIGSTTPGSGAFTTLSSNGGITNSKSGAASTYADNYTGTPYSGGSATTTFPLMAFTPAGVTPATNWNTNGTFVGINAQSGFTGNFEDYRINNGNTVFFVDYGGGVHTGVIDDLFSSDLTIYAGNGSGGSIILSNQGGNIRLDASGNFRPTNDNTIPLGTASNRFASLTTAGLVTGGNDSTRTTSTTMVNAWMTTGLVLPSVPINTTKSGRCVIYWQMSSTSYTATFGLGMNNAPTNVWGSSDVYTNATGALTYLSFTQSATPTTAISGAATASAANTTYMADMNFVIQTGASSAVQMTIYGQTSNASGTLSIMPGSTCYWLP